MHALLFSLSSTSFGTSLTVPVSPALWAGATSRYTDTTRAAGLPTYEGADESPYSDNATHHSLVLSEGYVDSAEDILVCTSVSYGPI